ncbi:MAG: hypothetical protein AB8I08_05255 [Sandaracinaceae bacterium]
MKRWKKVLLGIGLVFVGLGTALGIFIVVANEPRPNGTTGEAADALAASLEESVNLEAWEQTGAVQWDFGGRQQHLWDRQRHVARVRFDDAEALIHVGGPHGRAYVNGAEVHGEEAAAILERAYASFINDSFWLNPLAKFRDEGVTRSLVRLDGGRQGLLIGYGAGGLTPGDAYLWIPDSNGRPARWKMWVSIIPVGGVETSWDGWQELDTGAWVSTDHVGPFGLALQLTNVRGAADLATLTGGEDPFAPLFEE